MYLGVGLRSSAEAEAAVDSDRGMRHRSAQRFSYDHPSTTIAVISDNGPGHDLPRRAGDRALLVGPRAKSL